MKIAYSQQLKQIRDLLISVINIIKGLSYVDHKTAYSELENFLEEHLATIEVLLDEGLKDGLFEKYNPDDYVKWNPFTT